VSIDGTCGIVVDQVLYEVELRSLDVHSESANRCCACSQNSRHSSKPYAVKVSQIRGRTWRAMTLNSPASLVSAEIEVQDRCGWVLSACRSGSRSPGLIPSRERADGNNGRVEENDKVDSEFAEGRVIWSKGSPSRPDQKLIPRLLIGMPEGIPRLWGQSPGLVDRVVPRC
jgi:hypothetical protein